jgi:hypothetical protein
MIWALHDRTDHRQDEGGSNTLSVKQLAWIIEAFRSLWPYVERSSGTGRNTGYDASHYLCSMIRRLGSNTSTEAVGALMRLRNEDSDSYTSILRIVASEQTRSVIEASYTPPTLQLISAIANDSRPASGADIQAFLLEELESIADMIRSDDIDSWRDFYDGNHTPHEEDRCRNHLIGLLRRITNEIAFEPEAHVASDKEVDIACISGALRMPIEVKGQWHRDLWTAADAQLDRLYTQDCRADQHSIYLVLWFGNDVPDRKKLKSPGRGRSRPDTPDALRLQLIERSKATREGRVAICVLDVSHARDK